MRYPGDDEPSSPTLAQHRVWARQVIHHCSTVVSERIRDGLVLVLNVSPFGSVTFKMKDGGTLWADDYWIGPCDDASCFCHEDPTDETDKLPWKPCDCSVCTKEMPCST